MDMDDARFLEEAIALAAKALEDDLGGPFGALVVRDGTVLGRARNHVLGHHDPTAHAEVEAIREAARSLGTHELDGATIYASCEPCPMCLGAIYWAGIARVVYAADRNAAARAGFDDAALYEEFGRAPEDRRLQYDRRTHPEAERIMRAWKEGGGRVY
jgi:guanine deaminase